MRRTLGTLNKNPEIQGYPISDKQHRILEILAKSEPLNFYRISNYTISNEAKIPKGTLADNLPFLEKAELIRVEKEEKARVPGGKKKYYGLTELGILCYLRPLLLRPLLENKAENDHLNIMRVIEKYADRFPLVFGAFPYFRGEDIEGLALRFLRIAIERWCESWLGELRGNKGASEALTALFLCPELNWVDSFDREYSYDLELQFWFAIIAKNPLLFGKYQSLLELRIKEAHLRQKLYVMELTLPKKIAKEGKGTTWYKYLRASKALDKFISRNPSLLL